jgi:hypothetical protein
LWGVFILTDVSFAPGFLGADMLYAVFLLLYLLAVFSFFELTWSVMNSWDSAAGGYRISHVVLGEAWDTTARGPLNTLGASVADGDVLVAINRVKLTPATPPHALLANKAGKEVFLAIGSSGSESGRRLSQPRHQAKATARKAAPSSRH